MCVCVCVCEGVYGSHGKALRGDCIGMHGAIVGVRVWPEYERPTLGPPYFVHKY